MTIKIVLPEGEGVKSCHGTKVFTSDGVEIKNITRIQLDLRADSFLEAIITVAVGEIVGLDGVLPTLSRETHDQLEALGYKVER
jgi:hypothetical protein